MNETKAYLLQNRKRKLWIVCMAMVTIAIFLIDIITGPSSISIVDVIGSIFWPEMVAPQISIILWSIRIPMALMAILVGGALGIAGASMQTILNNALASPYTLGVSAGAGFGAALVIVFGIQSLSFLGSLVIPISAFLFACVASILIYSISRYKSFTSETMILTGIGLLFLFQALQSLMQYFASAEALQNIVFWTLGSLTKADWENLPIIGGVLCIIVPLIMRESWRMTALRLGDEKAAGLGVHVELLRKRIFLYVSLLTAIAVSFVGTIGFIGIVGPHIARLLVGEDQRFFLPVSCLSGMLILSAASVLSKCIKVGAIFPIGIVTAVIGVPFFFSLVLTKKGSRI